MAAVTARFVAMTPPKAETGSHDVHTKGDTAGVGVLDDGDARLREVVCRPPCRVRVDVVVVRHLFAVQLLGIRETAAAIGIQRGFLVRVLAVAEYGLAVPRCREERGEPVGVGGGVRGHEVRRDSHVVGGRVRKGLPRQPLALVERKAALSHGPQHVVVPRRAHHHRHRRVVLRGGAHHRRPADVDLLHAFVRRGAGCDRLHERIQIHHHELERLDARVTKLSRVVGLAKVRQDSRMHRGMQRLDPALEKLRKAREGLHRRHRHTGLGDPRRRRPRRHKRDASLVQATRELLQACLVVDADHGPVDGTLLAHGMDTLRPSTW